MREGAPARSRAKLRSRAWPRTVDRRWTTERSPCPWRTPATPFCASLARIRIRPAASCLGPNTRSRDACPSRPRRTGRRYRKTRTCFASPPLRRVHRSEPTRCNYAPPPTHRTAWDLGPLDPTSSSACSQRLLARLLAPVPAHARPNRSSRSDTRTSTIRAQPSCPSTVRPRAPRAPPRTRLRSRTRSRASTRAHRPCVDARTNHNRQRWCSTDRHRASPRTTSFRVSDAARARQKTRRRTRS